MPCGAAAGTKWALGVQTACAAGTSCSSPRTRRSLVTLASSIQPVIGYRLSDHDLYGL